MDPRINVILQDRNFTAQQKLTLQRYIRTYGVEQISQAFRTGVSKPCLAALKRPQLELEVACPEFRYPGGDPRKGAKRAVHKMREVHNSNMKNIQESIEHAQRNLVLASRRNMANRILSGTATSTDASDALYSGMRSAMVASTERFEKDPLGSTYLILKSGEALMGGIVGVGGSLMAQANPVLFAGGVTAAVLETYRRLRRDYPNQFGRLFLDIDEMPREAWQTFGSFANWIKSHYDGGWGTGPRGSLHNTTQTEDEEPVEPPPPPPPPPPPSRWRRPPRVLA